MRLNILVQKERRITKIVLKMILYYYKILGHIINLYLQLICTGNKIKYVIKICYLNSTFYKRYITKYK